MFPRVYKSIHRLVYTCIIYSCLVSGGQDYVHWSKVEIVSDMVHNIQIIWFRLPSWGYLGT